jgi:TPR repeat protein
MELIMSDPRTRSSTNLPENAFERAIYLSAGRSGPVDLVEAHMWFNIAAAGGDRSAAEHRDELAREMTREEVAAALRAARQWVTHQ